MIPTVSWLLKRKAVMVADLQMKLEAEDWHGVQDVASDIREAEAQIALLNQQQREYLAEAADPS